MKSIVKNIVIIAEAAFILILIAALIFTWYTEPEAVPASAPAAEAENKTQTVDADSVKERVTKNYYELSGKKVFMEDSTFGEIWIPALENVPEFSKDPEQIKNRNGRKFYVENSEVTSLLGVDVSVHQDNIDWVKVKNAGIDFAIVRLGFRGYGSGEAQLDENYIENITGARAAGLDTGVYFFSQAITVDEAIEEAQMVINSLDGLDVNYPIVYDWEIIYDDSARTDNVPVDVLTDCCIAFCEAIKDAGYTPMIYQNKKTTMFKLDLERLTDYDFWLAEYNSEPSYYYDFSMWQYTSEGSVPGIEGNVDLNISFKDYA
ncbi:MAG: glycoside hydrolase family 25 protein [Clostridium sp.]|nr:glycoside hydrolase family 25 protein [Clostridium sp.]MCM1547674.1 glycoside hydrolase family 25 protein [Ruminococcus sp.]